MLKLNKHFLLVLITLSLGCSLFAKEKVEGPFDDVEPKVNPRTRHTYNFDGMNVVIADYLPCDAKEAPTLKSWHEWTSSTYNFNVIQKQVCGPEKYPEMMMNYCVSDGNENYVFIIDNRSAALGVRANLFYDLSKIESVNYHNLRKYNQNAVNKLTRGRSFYAFNWEKNEPLYGVYFNKKFLQEKGFSSEYLYDLQIDGRWTWDAFERLCNMITADTDYDGDTDIYAMSSDLYDFAGLCLDSNNTSLITRDVEGKYSSNVINMKTMEAFYWMNNIWQKHQLPDKKREGADYCYKAFIEGKTAFLVGHQDPRLANHDFSVMNDDYGFVCFPLGPASDGIYKTISDTRMVVIPSCYSAEKVEQIATILDLWLEPVPTGKGSDNWKSNYINQFRDSRIMDETLVMMNDIPNPRMEVLINEIDYKATYKNIVTGINSPEEEYFYTKIGWSNVLDCYNQYVEKREKLSNDEIKEILEEKQKYIHRTKIEKQVVEEEKPEIKTKENVSEGENNNENIQDKILSGEPEKTKKKKNKKNK